MKKIKRFLKTLGYFSLMLIFCYIVSELGKFLFVSPNILLKILAIPTIIASLTAASVSASRILPQSGQFIKNSIFQVHEKNTIYQNSLSHPKRMIANMNAVDKKEAMIEECLNMFAELKQKDEKGINITYITTSNAMVARGLISLKRAGYIENFKKEPSKDRALIVEKMMFRNNENMLKKAKMYKMQFTLTDKERNVEEIKQKVLKK